MFQGGTRERGEGEESIRMMVVAKIDDDEEQPGEEDTMKHTQTIHLQTIQLS